MPGKVLEVWERKHGYSWSWKDHADDIEVWWEKDNLFIRQAFEGDDVELVILDHGQAYDMLRVLARALEVN